MKLNLISPQGEKIILNVTLLKIYNRYKAKRFIKKGYVLEGEKYSDIVVKFKLY